jgi:hypothetical protein
MVYNEIQNFHRLHSTNGATTLGTNGTHPNDILEGQQKPFVSRSMKCRDAECRLVERRFAECRYNGCRISCFCWYAECHYAECHSAKCRGIKKRFGNLNIFVA